MNSITRIFSTVTRLPTFQQVRYARKTFRWRFAYGRPPLFMEDEYLEAKENNQLEDLQYERIRMAALEETSSPLHDKELTYFSHYVMKGGRKDLAESLMEETLYTIKCIQYRKMRKRQARSSTADQSTETPNEDEDGDDIEMNPLTILKVAKSNVEPVVITRKIKRGGATYQVPVPISANDREWIAIKWLIGAVLDRPKPRRKKFPEVMAQELLDAFYGRGKVVKKRDDLHRLADANKAYAHYRWG